MGAAIRLARRHEGLTGTNPSVACVLVRDDGQGLYVVGSGVTAKGGRPHAEPIALKEAGLKARGATAYVTLEPCAHHGKTPPCAQTLIDAGVKRVVTAVVDPDERVNQLGHKMLKDVGIEVEVDCLTEQAKIGLQAYLNRKKKNRSHTTLKLAVSADGFLGFKGEGQTLITGPIAKSQTYMLRARHQAILVGAGTVIEDNPELTCRLTGLENVSPIRIILDPKGRASIDSKIFQTARTVRTMVVAGNEMSETHQEALRHLGCDLLPCEIEAGKVALPELLEDLAAIGIMSVLVEGGAEVAQSFLTENLIDEIVLLESPIEIADKGVHPVKSPVTGKTIPNGFESIESLQLGDDISTRFLKRAK